MELIVEKKELLEAKRKLLALNIPKNKKLVTNVVLKAENNQLLIALPGYAISVRSKIIKSGAITLPLFIWEGLLLRVKSIPNSEIIIVAENGMIILDKFTVKNQHIKFTFSGDTLLDIPLNARPRDILSLVFNNYNAYENAGIVRLLKDILSKMRIHLQRASSILREYKVTPEDLAHLIANKLELKEIDRFLKMLFEDSFEN
ncbi:MAG: hypothetical protein DRP73_04280 [Candidatus Omnitrophota bacterium]|nr:MAG: hypothetical protein DRP73_04280 [Candidatus Omnitrophota bacterium]